MIPVLLDLSVNFDTTDYSIFLDTENGRLDIVLVLLPLGWVQLVLIVGRSLAQGPCFMGCLRTQSSPQSYLIST